MKSDLFDHLKPIGMELPGDAAPRLAEIGEVEAAARLLEVRAERGSAFKRKRTLWPFQDRAWQYTSHIFGYIPPGLTGAGVIHSAGSIQSDETLRNHPVKITLDRLRIAEYPGGSTHQILLHFYARNQTKTEQEEAHYSSLVNARNGDHAALISLPVFLGLNVGLEGVAFRCATINVKNSGDESLISFLDSGAFSNGLKLLTIAQPALLPFAQMAAGLTKQIASRTRNVTVQKFEMGLDFSDIATRVHLAEGSYIAMQIPGEVENEWDWNDWRFRFASGHVVNVKDPSQISPYNYVVFSVSRMSSENEG
jgi:hypothetical protein